MIEADSPEYKTILDGINSLDKVYEGEVVIMVRDYGETIDIKVSPRERIKFREGPRRIKGGKDDLGPKQP